MTLPTHLRHTRLGRRRADIRVVQDASVAITELREIKEGHFAACIRVEGYGAIEAEQEVIEPLPDAAAQL